MANIDSKSGFKPVDGSGNLIQNSIQFTLTASNGTKFGIGDPVAVNPGSLDQIVISTVSGEVTYICIGFFDEFGKPKNNLPAGVIGAALCMHVKNAVFVAQISGAVLTAANVNQQFNLIAGVPNVNTGISTFEVDATSGGGASVVMVAKSGKLKNDFGEDFLKANFRFLQPAY